MLHEDDATIAEVRNKNTVDATGDWLCFLDADDELGAIARAALDPSIPADVLTGADYPDE